MVTPGPIDSMNKLLPLLALCVLLTGCESVSSRMHERFAPIQPKTRAFAADRKEVFKAAQQAVKDVGLLLGATSAAQGRINGYAPIRPGDSMRDTRQTTIDITVTEAAGGTEVAVIVNEHSEGTFPGGVSGQSLREHSLYGLYFAALDALLPVKGERLEAGKR